MMGDITGTTELRNNGFHENSDNIRCQSRKERKKCVKREKRRMKRQQQAREREHENGEVAIIEEVAEENGTQEEERNRQHELWLERERQAQEEFKKQQEKEEMIKRKEEEERKRIQAEWEEQQLKEQERLKKEKEKKDKKHHQLEGVMQYLDKGAKNGEDNWRNPDAPPVQPGSRKSQICSFYIKTGVCRFGERCSRSHPAPGVSRTVLLRAMYVNFAMEQSYHDDHNDVGLEYDQDSAQKDFEEFYLDVLPEFAKIGEVIVMRVCCNWERHLRGNVYVQYLQDDDAVKAIEAFNGRFYAGRALSCEHVAVEDWRTAICGLFQYRKCPKGKNCNFLHVFKNPDEHAEETHRERWRDSSRQSRHQFSDYSGRWRSYSQSSTRSSASQESRRSLRRRSREGSPRRTSRLNGRNRYSSRKSHSRARSRSRSRSRSPSRRSVHSYRRRSRAERSRSRSSSSRSRSRSPAERSPRCSRSNSKEHSPRSRSVKKLRGRSRPPVRSKSRSRSPEARSVRKSTSPIGPESPKKSRSRSKSRSPQRSERSRSRARSASESRSTRKAKGKSRKKHKKKRRKTEKASSQMGREDKGASNKDCSGSPVVNDGEDKVHESSIVKEAVSDKVVRGGHSCDEENLSESGDSDSSIDERVKLDIVEQEIARLSRKAREKGRSVVSVAPTADRADSEGTGANSESLQEPCTGDEGLAPK